MAPGDIFKIEIFSKETVIPVEHDARQSIFPLIHASCRYEDYEREFKTLTLMYGHSGDLVLVGIGNFDVSLLDLDLHLFQFSSNTRNIGTSQFEAFRQPVLKDIELVAVAFP